MQYFTHSHLNDYDILRTAKIGLEFEFLSKVNYHSTLLYLSQKLGINIKGVKEYHSNFKPTETEWKLEPDFSGGFSCAELITHPMSYSEARIMLSRICAVLQEISKTTDRTGLHINISFDKATIESVNPIKLILGLDESKIYELFPDRKNNIYCKSIKSFLPYKGYDFSTANSSVLSTSLSLNSEKSKYYGVNFSCLTQGRLEFRYIGGENYQYKVNETLELLDYFILTTYNSLNTNLNLSEQKMLRRFLDKNIEKYKSMSNIDSFYIKYPTVRLEVDKQNQYVFVKSYYQNFYDDLYELVSCSDNLHDCIINFDTDTSKLEIINADIKCNSLVEDIVFINCNIKGGDFNNCSFYSSNIVKSILNNTTISKTTINDAKLLDCKVIDDSELVECYFSGGLMDATMKSGIFRNGKIGENAYIDKDTKMLNSENNFFNLKIKKEVEFTKKNKK